MSEELTLDGFDLGAALGIEPEPVTPYVGVWIEIFFAALGYLSTSSPPMWGCGLKSTRH